MPTADTRTPYPFQEATLAWSAPRSRVAYFAEMRLGKSFMILRWLRSRKCRRSLVVSPLTVCPGWIDEADLQGFRHPTWLRGDNASIVADLCFGHELYVVNYDLLLRRPDLFRYKWDAVVLDESTQIRNPKARRTKACIRGFADVPNRAILTGLPNPDSELDYFCQMQFLHGSFMGCSTWWEFRQRHFRPNGPYDWEPKDRAAIKRAVDEIARCWTRKQVGLGSDKTRRVVNVALPASVRQAYRRAEHDFVLGDKETKWSPVVQGFCRQLCGGSVPGYEHDAKTDALLSLLDGDFAGRPVVVWFYFRNEMDRVEAAVRAAGRVPVLVRGATPPELRAMRVAAFQKGEADVFLGQMDCARFGLNLSRSSCVVNYSRSWNPESNWQSEDRVVHLTKREPIEVVDLVAEDTVDEVVREVLLDKRVSSRSFMASVRVRLAERNRRCSS